MSKQSRYSGEMMLPQQILAYPQACPGCRRTYGSYDAFLEQTAEAEAPVPVDALAGSVCHWRRCRCGEVMQTCQVERRSHSDLRGEFDYVLDALTAQGMPHEDVRLELRKVMRGDPGELLNWLYRSVA
ncbi:hypothetical protein [Jeongeupia naejangsanensis]|uniref:Uncharacterized protein n=1 Tax=Jeongeupia naejangsanensis TaxID=613195 RepID=A0ABS2BQ38_9NEIS|nr:hypothetical protein [Jeongeupia naejangsanensis]MBM3117749.1 hypothetical protein [Jeongeupia naejangsanensis]